MSKIIKKIKLGDIGKVLMCKRVLKHQTSGYGDIPFFKISTFGDKPDTFITKDLYEDYRKKYSHPRKGDILISAAGTVGKTVIYDGKPSYFQDSNIVWIDNNELILLNSFLYYFYQTKPWVTTSGSTITRIYNEDLRNIKISFPENIEDQQKIAAVLSTLDAKIELNNKINIELEAMAKTLYDYWFVQFDFPNENGKPYKSSGGEMVWSMDLKKEIPKGWEVKELGNFCEIYQPQTISEKEMLDDGKYYVFGANGVVGKYDQYNHKDSEIAITCRGNTCGNIIRTYPYSWITGNAMVVKPKDEKIHNEFIFCLLQNINIHKTITGSAQPQITRTNLSPVKILLPNENLLKKFSEQIKSNVKKRLQIVEENQKIAELRDFLLPMLMNGQVVVE